MTANWNNLKKNVSKVIKTNNNQEITGANLQSVLLSIINNIGSNATFAGIAHTYTSPGTPDGPIFYIALEQGAYPNFSNLSVDHADGGVVFTWNGSGWTKNAMRFATVADLQGLEHKIENLTLGKFYGFYPNSQSLPAGETVDGYAYVGVQNPYHIYNNISGLWTDSMSYIEAMTEADEEDITYNQDNKLSFKNRTFSDGMGYVILRKSTSIVSQLSESNTIYEIRYDFDLNGETISIPNNCALLFKGGSLINGKIVFNNTYIYGNYQRHILTECSGTVSNKTADCFMYGAYGDGEHDDTIALNRTVQNSKCSHIPSGVYKTTGSIFLKDNTRVFGDGDSTKIINYVESGYGKNVFIIGYMTSGDNYPSQKTIDAYGCTFSADVVTLNSSTDISNFEVGDIVFIRGSLMNDSRSYSAQFASKIHSISGRTIKLHHVIDNQMFLNETSVFISNYSKLRPSTGDIGFIDSPNWCYDTNTCHICENVELSNMSIEMAYPETGSGMYGIFTASYNCVIKNVNMSYITTPYGSNFSAYSKYLDSDIYYTGGISDMAEMQIVSVMSNLTFLPKPNHSSVHFGEPLTFNNGYNNSLINVYVNGNNNIGGIRFVYAAYCKAFNCSFVNLYDPNFSNSIFIASLKGTTRVESCYIRGTKRGISCANGVIIINTYIDTDEPGLVEYSESKDTVLGSVIKTTPLSTVQLGNIVGGTRKQIYFNNSLVNIPASGNNTIFNVKAGLVYGNYLEISCNARFTSVQLTVSLGTNSGTATLTSDNTIKPLKIRLIRIRTAGLRLMAYIGDSLAVDTSNFIANENVKLEDLIVNLTNSSESGSAVFYRPLLEVHN